MQFAKSTVRFNHSRFVLIMVALTVCSAGCVSKNENASGDMDSSNMLDSGGASMVTGTTGGTGTIGDVVGGMPMDMMPAAGKPADGGGMPTGPNCDETCMRLDMCITMECGAESGSYRQAMADECRRACVSNESFTIDADSRMACGDLIEFIGEQSGVTLLDACKPDPGTRPVQDDCQVFSEGYVRCLLARCPAGEPIKDELIRSAAQFCAEFSSSGDFDAASSARIYSPEAECDEMTITGWMDRLVLYDGKDLGTGHMAKFCTDGPVREKETCAAACTQLAQCLPVESPFASFRNPDRCLDFCLTREAPIDDVWTCRAQANDCTTFNQCGQGLEYPKCKPMADNAARCLAEKCEPAADSPDIIAGFLNNLCQGQVVSGQLQPVAVEHESATNSCENGAAASYVTYFTERLEGQEGSGGLIPYCRSGAGLEPEVCRRACEFVGPCIPEGSPGAGLKDQVTCEFVCLTNQDILVETWECLDEATQCAEVGPCFNRRP